MIWGSGSVGGAIVQSPSAESYPASTSGISRWIAVVVPLAFASAIAARRVHSGAPRALLWPVSHMPSPGTTSSSSSVELTTRVVGVTTVAWYEYSDVDPYVSKVTVSSVTVATI